MDRDSLGNVIVEPMDRVVLDSTSSPGNNLTSPVNTMDSTGSPGNTPTPTGCASPTMAPMMEVSFITGIIINIMMTINMIMMIINIIMMIINIMMMIRRKRRRSAQCCRKGGLPCSSW